MIIVLITFIIALSFFIYNLSPPSTEDEMWKKVFTIKMSVTFKNENNEGEIWNFTREDRAIALFMNSTWQTVYLINCSHHIEAFEIDGDGNPIAILRFPRLWIAPEENLSYWAEYKIVMKPRIMPEISEDMSGVLDDISDNLKDSFCGIEGPWQTEDPELIQLARSIVVNETRVLTMIKLFVAWIDFNIRYPSVPHEVPLYPNETFKDGYGDCDDKANLLITLCRICGIPAFLQIGCIYLPQKSSEISYYWNGHMVDTLIRIGWHGWAIVYVPPWGWLPVDLTYAYGLGQDPLNAIRTSAVISNPTVQFINITYSDYVALSRDLRSFLITHNFYISECDEMIERAAIQENILVEWPRLHLRMSDAEKAFHFLTRLEALAAIFRLYYGEGL